MSRRCNDGSVARNAPFGTDIQPPTKLKIVGGKQVEVPVNSPPTSAGRCSFKRNLPPLTPIEVQPPTPGYEEEANKLTGSFTFTNENARNLYSKTAPADKSNSHIHSSNTYTNLPGSLMVLPPINSHSGNSHSPSPLITNNNMIEHYSPLPGHVSPYIHLNQPDISLTDQLKDALEGYDSYLFQDMYKDLTEFDHKLSGYVSQAQANMVALRYQLPLSTNMLRFLFSNFAKDDNPDVINYEKLIQYLARAQLGSAEAKTELQESINRFVNPPTTVQSNFSDGSSLQEQRSRFDRQRQELNQQMHQQDMQQTYQQHQRQQLQQHSMHPGHLGHPEHQRHSGHGAVQPHQQESSCNWNRCRSPSGEEKHRNPKPLRAFSDHEDAKLLMLIEQQYRQDEEEPTDLLAMKNKFSAKDKLQQGTLTKKEIQDICFSLCIPVQGSLMEKLLQHCDTGEGQFSWLVLLDFLERVKYLNTGSKHTSEPPTAKTRLTNREESRLTPEGRKMLQESGPPPWEARKPLVRVRRKSPTDVEKEITCYDHSDEELNSSHLPSASTVQNDSSERSQLEALSRQHRSRAAQARKEIQARAEERDASGETWFGRYMHLAKGLYSADSTNTGYLTKEELYRIIRNYNLIYQLGFADSRIDRVVHTHALPSGMVPIEDLLETLRQHIN